MPLPFHIRYSKTATEITHLLEIKQNTRYENVTSTKLIRTSVLRFRFLSANSSNFFCA